jgi:hypothetical protein
MKHASWEGANPIVVFIDRAGKIRYQPIGARAASTILKKSHIQPIGIIMNNLYDLDGSVATNAKYGVYYKGKNVETATDRELSHPHIHLIESSLHNHGLKNEMTSYLPGVKYEKGIHPDELYFGIARKKVKSRKRIKRKCKCK